MDEEIEVLSESDVTRGKLRGLFKAAYLKTELDDDGDLVVTTDVGVKVIVTIDEERKFLKYLAIYGLKEDAPDTDKHEFVNKINDAVIMVRFSVPRADVLVGDYFLSFEEGITGYQIVNAARMIGRIVVQAIDEYDENDLVE